LTPELNYQGLGKSFLLILYFLVFALPMFATSECLDELRTNTISELAHELRSSCGDFHNARKPSLDTFAFDQLFNRYDSLLDEIYVTITPDSIQSIRDKYRLTFDQDEILDYLLAQAYAEVGYSFLHDTIINNLANVFDSKYAAQHYYSLIVKSVRCGTHINSVYNLTTLDKMRRECIDTLFKYHPDKVRIRARVLRYAGAHGFRRGETEIAEEYYRQLFDLHKSSDLPDTRNYAEYYLKKGLNLFREGRHYQAVLELNQGLLFLEDRNATLNMYYARLITLKGIVSGLLGDYNKSLEYIEIGLEIRTSISQNPDSDIQLANSYQNMMEVLRELNQYERALAFFPKLMAVLLNACEVQNIQFDLERHHLLMHDMGLLSFQVGDYDEAQRYAELSIYLLDQSSMHYNRGIRFYWHRNALYKSGLSSVFIAQGHYTQAINMLKPAIDTLYTLHYEDFRSTAEIHNILAEAYFLDGQLPQAWYEYNRALKANGFHFNNPDLTDVQSYPALLTSLFEMSRMGMADDSDLVTADVMEALIKGVTKTLFRILNDFRGNSSDDILDQADDWFNDMIEYQIITYKKTANKMYLNQAFELMEMSKGISLLQNLAENNFKQGRGNPDSPLGQYKLLQEEILHLEKKLHQVIEDGGNEVQLKSELREQQKKLDLLAETMPDHSQARFEVVGLSKLQLSLGEDEVFIQYIELADSYWSLEIADSTAFLNRVGSVDSINRAVEKIRTSIYTYYLSCVKEPSQLDSLTAMLNDISLMLGNSLISRSTRESNKNLVISPDGLLSFLPFEILSVDADDSTTSDILMTQHSVSYIPCASLVSGNKKSGAKKHDIVLFAPQFRALSDTFCIAEEYRANYLGPLIFNKYEVSDIAEVVDARVYDGTVTREDFMEHVTHASILHLATHGKIDYRDDDFSFLAFSNIDSDDPLSTRLYFKDLAALDISAECVVLSACESGLGKFYQGSGVKSMARGFLTSGAKSVISSLWAVNDESTAMIMTSFYRHLKEGESKDIALRNAKLDYIAQAAPEYRHPYYWAGFIAIGDMSPLFSKEESPQWVFYISLILAIILAGFFVARSKKRHDH